MLDRLAPAPRTPSSSRPATPRSKRASPNTRWPSACRPPCRSSPTCHDEPESTFELYGPDAADARHLRRQLPARPPPGRARTSASSSSSTRAGTTTTACPRHPHPVQRHRPALRRPRHRPQAPRPARRHPRRLGRRVRPHHLLPGQTLRQRLRPRPPSPLLHHLDGRRRRETRRHPRRDRRLRLQHHRGGVHVHDLHATILHLLGIDHERLTFKFQGRHFRLTDVHGKIVKPILA